MEELLGRDKVQFPRAGRGLLLCSPCVQVVLTAATDRALAPLKFILRNCMPRKLLTYTTPNVDKFNLDPIDVSLRLFTDMAQRDLTGLSDSILYGAGFPCTPFFGCMHACPYIQAQPGDTNWRNSEVCLGVESEVFKVETIICVL